MADTTENIPQYSGPGDYRGPTMGYLMKTHALAEKIIDTHKLRPADILDDQELALLRLFVADPSNKDELLRKYGMGDGPDDKSGTKAGATGSLTGYAIATDAFEQREIDLLRNWFETEEMVEELKGVEPRQRAN